MSLVHLFGNKPIPKVLDFFIINSFWDYSLRDVSKETGISYRMLQIIIPDLVKKGILIKTRTEGKAKLYKFNSKNELCKRLQDITMEYDLKYGEGLAKNHHNKHHKQKVPQVPLYA